jgi:hypothetical protein
LYKTLAPAVFKEFVLTGGSRDDLQDELVFALSEIEEVSFHSSWTDGEWEGDFVIKELAGLLFADDSGACVQSGPYYTPAELFSKCYGQHVLWEQNPEGSEYVIHSSFDDAIFHELFRECRCRITYNNVKYGWTENGGLVPIL